MKLRAVLVAIVAVAVLAGVALWRLADQDLSRWAAERLDFVASGHAMSGTIWLPDIAPVAVVVLVHGDGAQDRTAAGGYAPIINVLLERGLAVASWDKAGVGASEGNWRHQSMADRTAETRAALRRLKHRFDGIAIGALGFSQAGWVLPPLTREDADFLVLVGAAVSWRDQGVYFARVRLASEGLGPSAIDAAIAAQQVEDERVFGASAERAPDGMSQDRWRFVRQNRGADARAPLSTLDLPLLAVWGADDLNVDAARNAAVYRDVLAERDVPTRIILWPDATHGLLKAPAYNWQLVEDWSWFAYARFLVEGRHAFAPGALGMIADWITAVAEHR